MDFVGTLMFCSNRGTIELDQYNLRTFQKGQSIDLNYHRGFNRPRQTQLNALNS